MIPSRRASQRSMFTHVHTLGPSSHCGLSCVTAGTRYQHPMLPPRLHFGSFTSGIFTGAAIDPRLYYCSIWLASGFGTIVAFCIRDDVQLTFICTFSNDPHPVHADTIPCTPVQCCQSTVGEERPRLSSRPSRVYTHCCHVSWVSGLS
ncbi:hypothetical protein L227DRAFT_306930 [Lentinus tigrinus ALCF2SS1-6]|uniref:Uncharacterized protein n=1 Tax=Lentinus tigrinus ALCF2SS1-6 TaxID=1328759 RepID=A0A5C2RWI0_9APHY|nr:hypothetical protein L227DRAFT_306930 [Lentinus tigrinus ALCF2SS1-6]